MFHLVPVIAVSANTIVTNVQTFVGPILLLGIGIIAIKHLMTRQMTQFFQFMALAVLILLLFYVPGVLLAVVNLLTSFLGGTPATTPGVTNNVPTITMS